MEITLETYFDNGLFKIFAGSAGDSGISCEGSTPEECATAFKSYLEDYLTAAKIESMSAMLYEKTEANGDNIDLSDKDVFIYDCDTEKQLGEAFKVLSIKMDGYGQLFIEVDNKENDKWNVDDLSAYEIQLLLDAIN